MQSLVFCHEVVDGMLHFGDLDHVGQPRMVMTDEEIDALTAELTPLVDHS